MYDKTNVPSASSWGCELKYFHNHNVLLLSGQPLREAVSWNKICLKKAEPNQVSLFVRLWVEIYPAAGIVRATYSQPLREAVSWNSFKVPVPLIPVTVSLFVRLWVEMKGIGGEISPEESASSWGCELKCVILPSRINVTWSASSWGCELKYAFRSSVFIRNKSASSWGCELKCNREICMRISRFVSLFVRLWIEIKWQDETVETVLRQPLRETVRWNFCKKCNRIYFFASFFIRLWVGRKQR